MGFGSVFGWVFVVAVCLFVCFCCQDITSSPFILNDIDVINKNFLFCKLFSPPQTGITLVTLQRLVKYPKGTGRLLNSANSTAPSL